MKTSMLIVLAVIISLLQSSGGLQEEPDLVIQNYEWGALRKTELAQPVEPAPGKYGGPEERLPGAPISRSEIDRAAGLPEETTRHPFNRQETYALVKNVGVKTTKAVEWEYIFLSDADDQKELKRYRFRNKIKIAPGEIKFLSKDVNGRAPSKRQKVTITRIEYLDGSVWQRAESK